ncbi:helix-turn-helix transcriptional regulator [Fructobacillus cardui]|uniref:helix-turn-helix transcriptional regulator n=1 Tax=Fructobacillus cardui TaxID=2893170 RepID=UPI0030C81722
MAKLTLRALRSNKNETQAQAAKNIGVSPDTWMNWENQKTFPTVIQVNKIISHYGVNYDEINFFTKQYGLNVLTIGGQHGKRSKGV